jgi:hypothetical protein
MDNDQISLFETILVVVYTLGSLSALVYFFHTMVVLFNFQPTDFTAQLELFL